MKKNHIVIGSIVVVVALFLAYRFKTGTESEAEKAPIKGASGYTPYDAFTMLWSREATSHQMVWVNSGSDAGRLLTSKAESSNRPDFAVCTQGVVAGLATRGEDVAVIATLYVSGDAIRPVFRRPKVPLAGSRSLFIPRSSIEFAFDNLLAREGVDRSAIKIPAVEKTDFSVISSLLGKPKDEQDALDFAVLVEPFISNLVSARPEDYEVGEGGIYQMHYCLCVRREELASRRADFLALLRQLLLVDGKLNAIQSDSEFRESVWGRTKDGEPELLPKLTTFSRAPLGLRLDVAAIRSLIRAEVQYLVDRYPKELKMPENLDAIVDPSLLLEVQKDRVVE